MHAVKTFSFEREFLFYVVNKKDHPLITVTYFEKDAEKEGGRYVTFTGTVKKYDDFARELVFSDEKRIPVEDITG